MEKAKPHDTDIETSSKKQKRILSIDVFRGFTILAMVLVNSIGSFKHTPSWSRHVIDYGLTYVDLVAPFFIFAIALTFKMSFEKHRKIEGSVHNFVRFLKRYAALIGIGMIGGCYVFTQDGVYFCWGVLQAIGLAGIFTLIFIPIRRWYRLLIGLALLVVYQWFLLNFSLNIEGQEILLTDYIYDDIHGGVLGSIGWGLMLLLSTVICGAFQNKKMHQFLYFGFMFTILGGGLHPVVGISKERTNLPYILISIGIASLVFYLIWFVYDKKNMTKAKSPVLQPVGKNPLFLYLIHGILIGDMWIILQHDSPFFAVLLLGFLNVVIIWALGSWLDKKNIYIKF